MSDRRQAGPGSLTMEIVQVLLEAQKWTFARTMKENPHWYTLRKNWVSDLFDPSDQDFIDVVLFMRKYGKVERWPPIPEGRKYAYLYCGGFKYWTMGCRIAPGPYDPRIDTILINRKPVEVMSPEVTEFAEHLVSKSGQTVPKKCRGRNAIPKQPMLPAFGAKPVSDDPDRPLSLYEIIERM